LAGAAARLLPGFDLVAAWLDLKARIASADIVVTGEGCFDESSLSGKGPGAVAAHAGALGKTVHVFAGSCTAAASSKDWHLHAITPPGYPFERASREAPGLLAGALRTVF
jgi:glycerate kinase